jgi:predicted unusual protein kinase regulating ubiquinone biosynthesis (AarF/ABC1/UbiB family)
MRPSHLARYKDLGLLLVRHRHLVGIGSGPDGLDEVAHDADALAANLEELGPTFVKLGQLLSTRSDLLPEPYLAALARLQEQVEPFSFADVERTVQDEVGVRLGDGFRWFDSEPLAAASLGQVHRAQLRSGRLVAVKVQRPGIREGIEQDLEAIQEIAALADEHTDSGRRLGFSDMAAELRRSLLAELDYRLEASNLDAMADALADEERIVVPRPVWDYCSEHVLTMDLVSGTSIGQLGPLRLIDIDGPALAEALFDAYLEQVLVHGLFHADPHPGNVLVTDDGRLGLLDLGMVARVPPALQDELVKLLLAISDGRGRDAAEVAIHLGRPLDGFDADRFRASAEELVGRTQQASLGELQAGRMVAELTQAAADAGLRLPAELTMLGKALLNLDEVARTLDPTFDPNAAVQRRGGELLQKKLLQSASTGNVLAAALEAKQFAERLPGRVNQVLDALAEGKLTLQVQGLDEQELMRGIQKLANRVAAAVVVASLVIGAALIMRIDTEAQLFGYPAIAIVLFLAAAAFGLWLLVSIQLSDLPQRRHRRGRGRDRPVDR